MSYTAYSVYQQMMLIFTFYADLDKAALLPFVIIQIKFGWLLSTVKSPLPILIYTIIFEPHNSRALVLHCFKPFNTLVSWKPP